MLLVGKVASAMCTKTTWDLRATCGLICLKHFPYIRIKVSQSDLFPLSLIALRSFVKATMGSLQHCRTGWYDDYDGCHLGKSQSKCTLPCCAPGCHVAAGKNMQPVAIKFNQKATWTVIIGAWLVELRFQVATPETQLPLWSFWTWYHPQGPQVQVGWCGRGTGNLAPRNGRNGLL